jgi:hypothetical protein
MPKPNYGFEKRQRELEKKRKKEEKAMKKTAPPAHPAPAVPEEGSDTGLKVA